MIDISKENQDAIEEKPSENEVSDLKRIKQDDD